MPLAPSQSKLWETLEALDAQKRDVLQQLKAGVPEDLGDEYYVLARRLLMTEWALLEQLCGEPDTRGDQQVEWFGDGGDA